MSKQSRVLVAGFAFVSVASLLGVFAYGQGGQNYVASPCDATQWKAAGGFIMRGVALKKGDVVEIPFGVTFKTPPVVVVSSFWLKNDDVGHAETITGVSTSGFRVTSQNKGPDFYISWIAIGDSPSN